MTSRWLFAALLAGPAMGADFRVDAANGADTNDGLTWATALATVTEAVARANAAPDVDTIRVAGGVYRERITLTQPVVLEGGWQPGGATRDPLSFTTTLEGRRSGVVVRLSPGSEGSLLDGLTVTGGAAQGSRDEAGGITIESSGTLRDCVIEGNVGYETLTDNAIIAPSGGLSASRASGDVTVQRCIIQRNYATLNAGFQALVAAPVAFRASDCIVRRNALRPEPSGFTYLGAAGAIRNSGSTPITVMRNCLVANNACTHPLSDSRQDFWYGALDAEGIGALVLEDTVFEGNTWAHVYGGGNFQGSVTFRNCAFLQLGDAQRAAFTARENRSMPLYFEQCSFDVTRVMDFYIALGDGSFTPVNYLRCVGRGDPGWYVDLSLTDTLWQGGESAFTARRPVYSNVIDGDPLFVAGPQDAAYLSQIACGQATDSLAVDAGPLLASDVGMDAMTTRTDEAPDTGLVDWGYHHTGVNPGPSYYNGAMPPDPTGLRIRRGPGPRLMDVLADVSDLPFTDAPGVLSDPALRLLFYDVEWPDASIFVEKDRATDSVVLRF